MSKETLSRASCALLVAAAMGAGWGCVTTYDAYGRPVQTVDPGLAVAGIAAAGLVGYAIASDDDDDHHHDKHRRYEGRRRDDYYDHRDRYYYH